LFEREHGIIRRMVKENRYVLTRHALDEMIADDLYVRDIECIINQGSITRMEIDQQRQERKYVIFGKSTAGSEAEVVAKINRQIVIITVYLL